MKILLIVNDRNDYHLMEKYLTADGSELLFCECESKAISELEECITDVDRGIDIVVIERHFDKADCFQICELIKKISQVPIVMLAQDDDKSSESKAFDIGCSDYIKAPFTFDVLTKRIKNSLHKIERSIALGKVVVNDSFVVDSNNRLVIVDGAEIKLSNKEFAILNLLTTNPDKTFSRLEIIEHVWKSQDTDKIRIVDSHVKNIRKKTRTHQIETVSNIGYRLKRKTVCFD